MAIYHFSMKTISRSQGRSATAAIAYRAGVKIHDELTGSIHDYQKKSGVLGTGIVLPNGAPNWAQDREKLWNAVEQKETRKNSTVAREIIVALPAELPETAREKMVHDFARQLTVRHQCAVDFAIHAPSKQGDERNYHAHILMSTRRLTQDGFTEKTRELDQKQSGEVEYWRERWANHVNYYLVLNGFNEQVSHLSFEKQGIMREPSKHKGVAATAIERRQSGQAYIKAQREPMISPLIFGEPVVSEPNSDALAKSIVAVEQELKNLISERSELSWDNSHYIQIVKHEYLEKLETLSEMEQEKIVKAHIDKLAEIENIKFDNDDIKTEYLISVYGTFIDELTEIIAQQPEPEIKNAWEQCLDCLNEAGLQVANLNDDLNVLEQSGMALFQAMESSGLYAHQGIKFLKDSLKEQMKPLSEYLGRLKSEIESAIHAWECGDFYGAIVLVDYDERLHKSTLNVDFQSNIDDFTTMQEPLKNFLQNKEQDFKVLLAEPRANELTLGSLRLAEPRL